LEFSASFTGTPAGARAARHFVRDALAGADDSFLDTILLLTSEVATNAVLHTGGMFEVRVEVIDNGGVRVSVTDDSKQAPQPRVSPVDATTGRGLNLVDALASAWGVDDHRHGKVVWFEVGRVSARAESDLPGR
jgi:anti-sigma regulatory factor (Ser/Thr protein kinase)